MAKGKPALISLRQAAAAGVERVRKPEWVDPCDHIKIDIISGGLGPWAHLYAPINKSLNGRDPVDILIIAGEIQADSVEFIAHDGPDSKSPAYVAAVAAEEWTPATSDMGDA